MSPSASARTVSMIEAAAGEACSVMLVKLHDAPT